MKPVPSITANDSNDTLGINMYWGYFLESLLKEMMCTRVRNLL